MIRTVNLNIGKREAEQHYQASKPPSLFDSIRKRILEIEKRLNVFGMSHCYWMLP